ncbi:ribulose-phosphate 3-epimerase [Echinicola vietnamensis]|uniref:Ribulose-phosphate 3-epimerase n=1 Tax=Echinicola vietnamensis (strain DSM 17526 / LMG 23754 / KMM 6221) TaxID=926556 RepID=L0G448_ECHVK|nr:ribulose-phosphate 3-epimerase [Echinicola vietnamensis]AGA79791.1 ribulose-phosphate 3-epimerase [Echinicola vietnamensis DSM 17526]
MDTLIAPSVLAADFANLQSEIELINDSTADLIHVDIMDGVFVPNISFGFPVVDAIKKHAQKPLDVHLMIVNPDQYLKAFKAAGAETITVHLEACQHLHRTVQAIHELDCKAGVAINPHTNVELLRDIIRELDTVIIMSVNPGFGGQEFIEHTYEKVRNLKAIITASGSSAKIEIDGGVNMENAYKLIDAGADILVAGSFVFNAEDPKATIAKLKEL